ncbi:MAG: nuclease [Methanobrevibacter sp.]|nr:nuclease [Methanobrevibacter sp.]
MFEEEKDDKIYNLLISKGIDANSEYSKFVEKLYSKKDFLWKESVAGLYSSLSEKFFSKIDVIIILSGLYNKNKEDFDKIIEAAIKFNKPIVLVKPQGMEELPENIEKIATAIVGWNVNCIIDTLKEATEDFSK